MTSLDHSSVLLILSSASEITQTSLIGKVPVLPPNTTKFG